MFLKNSKNARIFISRYNEKVEYPAEVGEIRGGKMMFEFVGSVIALILFLFSYMHLKRFVNMIRVHILMGWMVSMLR